MQIFFQTSSGLLNPTDERVIPTKDIRTHENHQQILASTVLDILYKEEKPANTLALMAITEKDLFPSENWNYVFGLASYTKRIGVSSIYRLQNSKLDSLNFDLCLKRLINISSHEIGHMFKMKHCITAHCVMNGSNGLHETDLSPNRLCSECQKKLQLARGFDLQKD
ncbi:archaemetzincin [Niabella hibiscisoli]|uniref:archaemetzincin n=1 Tax=Niabella hibiscisoli TaxID=1825928 RepID=UPI001F0F3190|nr:archaemetzincin [Niabella hibiscisoli]MCH5715849.1 archaemetzincin [Niabella hibiscisoli]